MFTLINVLIGISLLHCVIVGVSGTSYTAAAPDRYRNQEAHIPWHSRTVINHRFQGRFLHGTDEEQCIDHFRGKKSQLDRLYSLGHAFVDLYDESKGTLPTKLKALLQNFEEGSSVKDIDMKLYSWANREVWGGPNYLLADECINTILRTNPAALWDAIPAHEQDFVIFQWRGMKEAFVKLEDQVEILAQ